MAKLKQVFSLLITLLVFSSVFVDCVSASGDFEEDFMFHYKDHLKMRDTTQRNLSFQRENKIFNFSKTITTFMTQKVEGLFSSVDRIRQQPVRTALLGKVMNNILGFPLTNYLVNTVYADEFTNTNVGKPPSGISGAQPFGESKISHNEPTLAPNIPKTKRILVIDGGGIRGVIPAYMLYKMEQDLKDTLGREVRIAECFDLIVGTSTGGIIALGLNVPDDNLFPRPKNTAERILDFYVKKGRIIFPQTGFYERTMNYIASKYSADPLRNILQEEFEGYKLSDSVSNVMITSYDVRGDRPYLFTNYDRPIIGKKRNLSDNYFMRDVARATSAAPTYFEGAEIWDCKGIPHAYVDGGVANNNPTLTALLEARESFGSDVNFVVVSLGTGEAPATNYRPGTKDAGKLQWASIIPEIMMKGAAQLAEIHVEKLEKESLNGVTIKYLRFQPTLQLEYMALDNADDENIKKLMDEAGKEYDKKRDKFRRDFIDPFKEEEDKVKQFLQRSNDNPHEEARRKYELAIFKLRRPPLKSQATNETEAKQLLRAAAEDGYSDASYILAKILEGEFNKTTHKKDKKWHELLIHDKFRGHSDNRVFDDNPTLHDLADSALTFYNRTAKDPRSQYSLEAKYRSAHLYNKATNELGYPLTETYDKGVLHRVAKEGHREAEYKYAMYLLSLLKKRDKPEVISYHSTIDNNGDTISLSNAITYLESSSNKDYAKAQYQLALIYEVRRENKDKIKKLYENAAYQGYAPAKYQLAKFYESQNNNEEFERWVFDSARDGYVKAIVEVGSYCFNKSEFDEAGKWYSLAANREQETVNSKKQLETIYQLEAQYRLAKVYQRQQKNTEYRALLEEVAKKNHKDAAFEMGEQCYKLAIGLGYGAPDQTKLIEARDWYEVADKGGHKEGSKKLEEINRQLRK